MLYIKDGVYPIPERHIRATNKSVSFPIIMRPEDVLPLGYERVIEVVPEYDASTYKATELPPVKVAGVWTQQWLIEPKWATIDDAKDALITKVDAKREKVASSNVRYNGENYPIDQDGVRAIESAVTLVTNDPNRFARLKKKNGRIKKLSAADVNGLYAAMVAFQEACWDAFEVHQNAIDALIDMDSAVNYHVNAGWP